MKNALVVLSLLIAPHAAMANPAAGYQLLSKMPIPGDGGYDYLFVDEGARRLYVSHDVEVAVLDADSGAVVGKVTGLSGVHGIATVPGLNKGFITNGKTDSVTMFDTKTLKTLGQVKTGTKPDAIIYDPASKHVLSFNNKGGTTTVIDPAQGTVVATIELGGAPEFARADGKGTVWVNLEDKHQVVRIDSRKNTVTAHWSLTPCEEPTGMAFDAKNRRLFVGCNNSLMAVVNADSGKVITTLPIGPGVDAVDFDPSSGDIFNSCGGGDGTLSVIHQDGADKYSVVENVKTTPRAKTLTADLRTHRVFLSAAAFALPKEAPANDPKAKPVMVPGSFNVLVFGKGK